MVTKIAEKICQEGQSEVGIFCHQGRHRSVSVAQELARLLAKQGFHVECQHLSAMMREGGGIVFQRYEDGHETQWEGLRR